MILLLLAQRTEVRIAAPRLTTSLLEATFFINAAFRAHTNPVDSFTRVPLKGVLGADDRAVVQMKPSKRRC